MREDSTVGRRRGVCSQNPASIRKPKTRPPTLVMGFLWKEGFKACFLIPCTQKGIRHLITWGVHGFYSYSIYSANVPLLLLLETQLLLPLKILKNYDYGPKHMNCLSSVQQSPHFSWVCDFPLGNVPHPPLHTALPADRDDLERDI